MSWFGWFIFFLIIQIIHALGTFNLYKKAGFNPYLSIIPIYNGLVLMKIIKRPWWWIVLLFLPVVNLLIFPIIWIETARSFGRKSLLDTILVVLSLGLYIYIINYNNKSEYLENRNLNPQSGFEEWFSSIIFAVILATVVHTYFIQPFIIPTGSLERTLLVGDFLFVSKYNYGARVPKTPVAFPMVHDTIVGTGLRSYLNKPQLPYLRLPKLRGFNNPFRVEYEVINLDTISETGLNEVTPEILHGKGLVGKNALVKILGRGDISSKVDVSVHAISKSAEESIKAAGGSITILPKPWGDGRPPAKGNALTNR